jgi:hypothetical protein
MPATFFPRFQRKNRNSNNLFHFCPRRHEPHRFEAESREAAERKARELTDLGLFEVQIDEEVQIEEAECSGK